jgi:transposase
LDSTRKVGRPPLCGDLTLKAILYRLRVGCGWRDLPTHFGHWNSLYRRWRQLVDAGVWAQVLGRLTKYRQGRLRLVDSTYIKVHKDGQGARGGSEPQCIGLTKGGLNSKLTVAVDETGRVVAVLLFPGQTSEKAAGMKIAEILKKCLFVGDKGFDCDELRALVHRLGGASCIPPRSNRLDPLPWDPAIYRARHKVENFFARLKRDRGIATRYDKLAKTFLALATLAAIIDWLK